MAHKTRTSKETDIQDYRHETAKRKNNPPAGLASQGMLRETLKQEYAYNPHLPPVLRFDESGEADRLPELLEEAQKRPLNADEVKVIAEALRHHEPWLEWAGKREAKSFVVEPVALHIHERVSAKAILRIAARQDVQRDLFADPEQEYREAVQFYQHDVDWSNRLILGDSLMVMSSLARREDLTGKVQMIYIDPPYGIKFSSNFQPTVFQRDVKDRAQDLTREPEQIKAYRDTWNLGIHSYLAYLRDRLIAAKELLADSGSIFVQIGDENVHRVRCLMDEVFGGENFCGQITYKVTSGTQRKIGPRRISDFILWYAKDIEQGKFRRLYLAKTLGEDSTFTSVQLKDSTRRSMTKAEKENPSLLPVDSRPFRTLPLHSQGAGDNQEREFQGRKWAIPSTRHWTYSQNGFARLVTSGRIQPGKSVLEAVYYFDDFQVSEITTTWNDTAPETDKDYVIQTSTLPIQRCLLMTTDPGDLVLDPTCVRKGTRVWAVEAPPMVPPHAGGRDNSFPNAGGRDNSFPNAGRRDNSLPGAGRRDNSLPGAGRRDNSLPGAGRRDNSLPNAGRQDNSLPACGEGRGGGKGKGILVPIESLRSDDYILAHDGKPHRVLRTIRRSYKGIMIKIQHSQSPAVLWLTADHRVLVKRRPRSLGGPPPRPSPHAGREYRPSPHAGREYRPSPHAGREYRPSPHTGREYRPSPHAGREYRPSQPVPRVRGTIGGTGREYADWSAIPLSHRERRKELRNEMTPPERKLWQVLRRKTLGVKFRRQHPIGPYIADFYSRQAQLVVEVDGALAHGSEEAVAHDKVRDDFMQSLGLRVLRIPAAEVERNLEGVYDVIEDVCEERFSPEGAEWMEAAALRKGDIVFFGPKRIGVEINSLAQEFSEEEVYDLEVEGAHSFLTEVCAVHNCGSGTTAYVAEQWGRRWIAIDTSRVAIALARQRLLTATFDYYKLKSEGISGGFIYKTVPHITLKSIAQNVALDPIFARHEPILAEKLSELNRALKEVTPEIRAKLLAKLAEKERQEGKNSITEADRRRWQLPKIDWKEWEVPYDTDADWPPRLQEALIAYRKAWRAKMDAVNACIEASAEHEELVDQPEVDNKKLRVSGPFTVEAVQPAEELIDLESSIDSLPHSLPACGEGRGGGRGMETFTDDGDSSLSFRMTDAHEPTNVEAYLNKMIRLLRNDGVRFPNNKIMKFAEIEPLEGDVLHAEGYWQDDNNARRVAIAFGPQHGPVTAMQVEDCLRAAYRYGYDELVFAGFSFDGAAQAAIQDAPPLPPRIRGGKGGVRVHIAHINPDVTMGDLLKDTPSSQLFTVFGLPRTSICLCVGLAKASTNESVAEHKAQNIRMTKSAEYVAKMEGVDIYNPVDNSVYSAGADKVAAWFLDSDYDGRTFCITQAFFPDKKAWSKIARALKGVIDEERFEAFSGTESLPFTAGKHNRVAVKVIDPRGNEVMRVHNLKYT